MQIPGDTIEQIGDTPEPSARVLFALFSYPGQLTALTVGFFDRLTYLTPEK